MKHLGNVGLEGSSLTVTTAKGAGSQRETSCGDRGTHYRGASTAEGSARCPAGRCMDWTPSRSGSPAEGSLPVRCSWCTPAGTGPTRKRCRICGRLCVLAGENQGLKPDTPGNLKLELFYGSRTDGTVVSGKILEPDDSWV